MGNLIVTPFNCAELSQLPADDFATLTGETYTVTRTDGREETGWKIDPKPHSCTVDEGTYAAHATNRVECHGIKEWRFFMHNGACCLPEYQDHSCRPHACGWRTCDLKSGRLNFWPTRLETPEDRMKWWLWLDGLANTLKYPELVKETT